MISNQEEKALYKKYLEDCNRLWIRFGRTAATPPTEAYDHEKARLKADLEKEVSEVRKKAYEELMRVKTEDEYTQ